MLSYFAKKIFGSSNERVLKSIKSIVAKINALEPSISQLSDNELKANTIHFKKRLNNNESLDHILPEAFATVREAALRVLNMRHFDVQLLGGIVLHRGMIAEMKTGEGKTLVATLAIYLNALTGKGVHLVTVNDYLAKRDAEEMGKLYKFLGLTVGCITNETSEEERKAAYAADITYGTNNEFGFDYLRDNLKYSLDSMVQREFNFAIVDEVDSILIDEARTPLIISGPTKDNSELYYVINHIVSELQQEDYEIDEKSKNVAISEHGNERLETILRDKQIIAPDTGLYDFDNMLILHHVNQALKAHQIFRKDVDYIVKDGKVMIIDEFTGRIMDGRRYSEGLHQALEAKEKVMVQDENQTLASVTFQNYFRLYNKLAGMTGTAMTEANEFEDIYKLQVVEIPTNLPITRIDEEDEIYKTAQEKYNAILNEIKEAYKNEQPVLVGTISIEKSEYLSSLLKKHNIKHNVLNARYHEQEADIIAQAGRSGTITIATNMAGRGTDIMLGGNVRKLVEHALYTQKDISKDELYKNISKTVQEDRKKVLDVGGLYIICTERHESRRIDNQLRGRAGRQGDAGRTKFFLSLEDDLMRIFGSEKISTLLTKLGLKEGEAIIHPWISKSLQMAQQRVEARNYEIRRNLLKFDDVMNEQRKVIYSQRINIMSGAQNLIQFIQTMITDFNQQLVSHYIPKKSYREEWDIDVLEKEIVRVYNVQLNIKNFLNKDKTDENEILEFINYNILQRLGEKQSYYGQEVMQNAVQRILLITLDHLWKDHLHALDYMRSGINLRAYAQKDPLNEYKIEAFKLFQQMLTDMEELIIQRVLHLEISHEFDHMPNINSFNIVASHENPALQFDNIGTSNINEDINTNKAILATNLIKEQQDKIARNEKCPCGSGKKYKHCHGSIP